jgi:hypothetical protein
LTESIALKPPLLYFPSHRVVDFDADGNALSIDIDLASKKLDLTTLEMVDFPGALIKHLDLHDTGMIEAKGSVILSVGA